MHVVNDTTGKAINMASPRLQAARDKLEAMFEPVTEQLKTYQLPPEKFQPIVDYAMQLLIKHINWRPERLARKTAEYFKLKKANA